MTSKEILTMRAMAWERGKGELRAYLNTFWPEYAANGQPMEDSFESADKKIKQFIEDIEEGS